MAPKNRSAPKAHEPLAASTMTSQTSPTHTTTHASPVPLTTPRSKGVAASKAGNQSAQDIAYGIWRNYVDNTAQRTKLIDVFMGFLVMVGVLQFVYCVLVGNYPFNAFLSGFSATVGQFVLTASLRIQTNPENKSEFYSVSPERAFADYIFGSMLLHFFCVNFIN